MSEPLHYSKGPSSAHRWMNCPGSLVLERGEVNYTSEAAEQGTLMHELAERMFNDPPTPSEMARYPDDHARMATGFVDYCKMELRKPGERTLEWGTETKIKSAIPGHGGTIDYFEVAKDEAGTLICDVVDLKTGSWKVQVEKNKQCLCYAGLILELYPDIDEFRIHIYQPRTGENEPWTVEAWKVREHQLLVAAVPLDSTEVHAGDWCRFCRAKAKCPAVQRRALELAQEEFEETDVDRMLELLELAPTIKRALEEIPLKLQETIEQGGSVPGYKLVTKLGNRRWICGDKELLRDLKRHGIARKDATDIVVKSVASMEAEGYGDEIETLWERPDHGRTLAKLDDPREEWHGCSGEEFQDY